MRDNRFLILLALPLLAAQAGCFNGGINAGRDGNVGKPVGEPNNTFDLAIMAEYAGDVAALTGSIESATDVDVFDLGPMDPGDRITVDSVAFVTGLDAAIAIFDSQGRLFAENDDRDLDANELDPYIDQAVRYESSSYFLAIAASPFAPSTGIYRLTVTVQRGGPVPDPVQQVFFLDFDGGTVDIPDSGVYTVDAFDTANISPAYEGMTDEVKAVIVQKFKVSFDGLDVIVVTSDEGEDLVTDPYSRILFGAYNPTKYGISEDVDPYNTNPRDVAIIFTETFRPSLFERVLTAEELGLAIGNVAAHEAGHLLGLNHVADVTALMDTTGGPDSLLADQVFKQAPLDETIFPIGDQDAWLLLVYTLGLL